MGTPTLQGTQALGGCTSGGGPAAHDSIPRGDSTPAKRQGCQEAPAPQPAACGSGEAVMAGGVPVATTILRRCRVTGASLSPALVPFPGRLAGSRTRPVGAPVG